MRGDPAALEFVPALRAAARLFGSHLRLFTVVGVLVILPLTALNRVLEHAVFTGIGIALGLLLAVVVAAYGEAMGAGLAEHALRREQLGHPRLPLPALLRSLPLGTLAALAVIVGTVVAVGLALLAVPGLVAYAWLAVASPVASFRRLGVAGSLRTSVALVRGRFWKVAALTSATFVPAAAEEALTSYIHERHVTDWLAVPVEAAAEALVIGFTAAVVVVVYRALEGTP